ncbi:vanadium-dependent haloperoxidase [Sphingomonas sp.]|uniref:vanadium-dependent haloperoxidase n=1 Tax=Sphingomonas sp. TaxID=28214 RepID=UPI0018296403|nr:vanadium-dependent haloperoxidase [Sphingomonas sp.]MBA3510393.1 vanadium-dependent haloperoxidase [Sphingomonas sp.]
MRRNAMMVAATAAVMVPQPAMADTVTDWWEIAAKFNFAQQVATMPAPPETQRASARAALAVFEAVNAIDRRYQSYLNFPAAGAPASQDAAAATAAFKVLLQHYPQNKSHLEDGFALTMAQIPDGPAKQSGMAIGEQAAQAVMQLGSIDPAVEQSPYRPRTTPGEWIGASPPSLEPYWAAFKPWVIKNVDTVMVPPPPALTSATWARDYEEVRRLGARNSKDRTPVQTLIAKYRQGYDLSPTVRYITDRPGRRQVDNARLLALYQLAMDDAVQAMIVAKQRYNFWRPITAIRNGDRDGNDATQLDAGWLPLLPTPNFQEYPCGHCTAVAVQAEVLKLAGGLPANVPVRIAAGGNPNIVVQTVRGWDEAVRQVSDSRMYGGVHYRFSNDAGEDIGRRAARIVVSSVLRPLPAASRSRR